MSEPMVELTSAAQARRETMHDELIDAMRRLHRRRRTMRRTLAGATALLSIIAGVAAWLTFPTTAPMEPPGYQPQSLIHVVRTDPAIIERFAAAAAATHVVIVDDQKLVSELAAIGRQAGVIRSEEGVWLTSDVTDAGQSQPQAETAPLSLWPGLATMLLRSA